MWGGGGGGRVACVGVVGVSVCGVVVVGGCSCNARNGSRCRLDPTRRE